MPLCLLLFNLPLHSIYIFNENGHIWLCVVQSFYGPKTNQFLIVFSSTGVNKPSPKSTLRRPPWTANGPAAPSPRGQMSQFCSGQERSETMAAAAAAAAVSPSPTSRRARCRPLTFTRSATPTAAATAAPARPVRTLAFARRPSRCCRRWGTMTTTTTTTTRSGSVALSCLPLAAATAPRRNSFRTLGSHPLPPGRWHQTQIMTPAFTSASPRTSSWKAAQMSPASPSRARRNQAAPVKGNIPTVKQTHHCLH